MTGLFRRLFGESSATPAYDRAMSVSDDLLSKMQDYSARSTDAARAVMADIWAQNRNVPFMTTVVEAVEEAKSPLEQKPSDR